MANKIVEYRNPVGGLTPNNIGAEAYAQEGRRVGAFYHSSGQQLGGTVSSLGREYQGYLTQQDISHNAPGFAKAMVDMTTAWNNMARQQIQSANANIAPPAVPPKFANPTSYSSPAVTGARPEAPLDEDTDG